MGSHHLVLDAPGIYYVTFEKISIRKLKNVRITTNLQEYSKSPSKKVKKEQPDRERVRNTAVAQDTDISPTAMLDQT